MDINEQPKTNYDNARRKHYEYYAPAMASANWYRLTTGGLLIAVILLAFGSVSTHKALAKQRVLVLQPSTNGTMDPIKFVSLSDLKAEPNLIKGAVINWAIRYYARNRTRIAEDRADSLLFFDELVKRQIMHEDRDSGWIQTFMNSGEPECRVKLEHVLIAADSVRVDFAKEFWLNGRVDPALSQEWTAQVPYHFLTSKEVTDEMLLLDPIGLRFSQLPTETRGFQQ